MDLNIIIIIIIIKLKQIDISKGVCLLTYKKDRKVTVIKDENFYTLHEDGFYKEIFSDLDEKELRKLLKTMIRKEFPRSNRLHLNIV